MQRADLGVAALAALAAIALAEPAGATIDPGSPTTEWRAVGYPLVTPDPNDDHQTGIPDSDIVGDVDHPAFYLRFDDAGTADPTDGTIGFRVRLGADTGPAGFTHFFGAGMDVDGDGSIDVFAGVDASNAGNEVAIWNAGTDLNISPNTTSIDTPPLWSATIDPTPTTGNYAFQPITSALDPAATIFDLDNDGNVDHFLSYVIPFADMVTALAAAGYPGFTDQTVVSFVIGTSNTPNALNNDIGGPDDSTLDPSQTWSQLGALSSPLTPVPEPAAALLTVAGSGLALARRCARRPRSAPAPRDAGDGPATV